MKKYMYKKPTGLMQLLSASEDNIFKYEVHFLNIALRKMQYNYHNGLQTNIVKWNEDCTNCDENPVFLISSTELPNELSIKILHFVFFTLALHWAPNPGLLWLTGDRKRGSELINLENYICLIKNGMIITQLPK